MVRGNTGNLVVANRKTKGLHKMFTGNAGCGIPSPFYYTNVAVNEGTPMKYGSTQDLIVPCAGADGAGCVGLSLQRTYDESTWDPQLRGYHFVNDTGQRLDGSPIGLLTGSGYALTLNYAGAVKWGDAAYIGASGKLAASGNANDKLPIVFEESGTDGDKLVRIRFDFPLASRT